MAKQPLSDVRVLDLTWHIAGPACTKFFADYGADVIKIERPDGGDPARSLGPFYQDDPHPEKSGLFLFLNTNKRSITLNLKSQTGKKILKELVQDADILVENFSPRVMPGLGLDYKTLEKINPKLVMTSISNFGLTGPYRDFKASEIIIYAMGGAMCSTGVGDCEPVKKGMNVIQHQGGAIAAVATMMAFYASRAQAVGQHVDVSLMETQMGAIDRRMSELLAYEYNAEITPRMDIAGLLQYPYGIFPCKDGYVDVAGGFMFLNRIEGVLKMSLMEAYGGANQFDETKREEFLSTIWYPWILERNRKEIVEVCQEGRVLSAPINTTADLLADPQYQQRGFWTEADHPVVGKLTYPGRPAICAELPWKIRKPAPMLGQHNVEVYTSLGYSKDDLVKLREGRII